VSRSPAEAARGKDRNQAAETREDLRESAGDAYGRKLHWRYGGAAQGLFLLVPPPHPKHAWSEALPDHCGFLAFSLKVQQERTVTPTPFAVLPRPFYF
jgi:hypothetical protein